MAADVWEYFPKNTRNYYDGTTGHGGHICYILDKLKEEHPDTFDTIKVYGTDADTNMIAKAEAKIADYGYTDKAKVFHSSYAQLDEVIQANNLPAVEYVLLDIGVNMEHFQDAERGFSTQKEGPLDMRFNTKGDRTARDVLMTYTPDQLAELFEKYGDFREKRAKEIALHITTNRRKKPLETTTDLWELLREIGIAQKKLAVIFQVLRIETNRELEQLETFLSKLQDLLAPGGRCAIISFHSIEDRIVKLAFKSMVNEGWATLCNKKAIKPHYKEVEKNRASRSAVLRVIEKISA